MTTETTSNATPVSAPEGHDEAMAAKFDAAQSLAPAPVSQDAAAAPQTNERPAGLPEKFSSWEDLAKAYSELEQKQSADLEKPAAPEIPATPEAAQERVTQAGLDFAALTAEYDRLGTLSDETFAALDKAGIPKDTVDAYIAGQQAIAQQAIDGIMNDFGGADEYGKMVAWASTGLSQAEVAAFNQAMDNGSVDSIKLTIAGLKARYEAANGKEPALLNGGADTTSTDVFRSTAEMTAAMKDPRYAKDPAYRSEVQQKVGRSNILR